MMEKRNSATSSASVATQQTSRLPENIEDILTYADPPFDKSSPDKLYDQLSSSGVFLANKTQKFWVDKKLNCNCFMLYARALSIIWVDNPRRYWEWKEIEESSEPSIEVAVLNDVCWLDVCGKLDTRKLSPGVMYGVSFHVILVGDLVRYTWSGPANVSLELKGVEYEKRQMNFIEMLEGTWTEIPVAEFIAPAHDEGGEMKFSLWEHGGNWKSGLIIEGVSIRPL